MGCPKESGFFPSYIELASPFCTNVFDIGVHIDIYMLHLLNSVYSSVIPNVIHI